MAGAILGPVVPGIRDGLGVSGALAGLIITTHGGLIVLTSPIAGALVDRYGPRQAFIGGLSLYGIGGGAGLLIESFWPLLLSRAVLGVGVAFLYTGVTVLIYDLYEGEEMDRVLGLRSSANSLGAAIWPLVGGALGTVAWQLPFGVYLIALPLGALAVITVPATGRGRKRAAEGDSGAFGQMRKSVRTVGRILQRRPGLVGVYLLYFGANVLLYTIIVYYPQLLEAIGVSSALGISLYLAASGAAGGLSGALYGRLVIRATRTQLVTVAFLLWSVAFGTITLINTPVAAAPPVFLFGLGIGLVFPSTFAWVETLAPEDRQGQFSSYIASFGYTGQFLSPLLFGPLVGPLGVRGAFGVAGICTGLAALGLIGVGMQTRD